jgi:hypothetical protein
MTAAERPPRWRRVLGIGEKREPVLIAGHAIHGRFLQQIGWSIGLGTLILGLFFSGLYDIGTQVHWVVHIWFIRFQLPWAKPGWDANAWGLIGPHSWVVNTTNWGYKFGYRHALRDIVLPAFATMGALSIAGGAKKPAGWLYTAIAPFLVLATAIVMIIGGMWLALRAGTGSLTAQQVTSLHFAESLALGLLTGRVLHYIWRPAGTRIQTFSVERLIDRRWRRGGAGLPAWVRYPLAPPTMREEGAKLVAVDEAPGRHGLPSEAERLREQGTTSRSSALYWLAGAAVVVVLSVDFVGFIVRIWAGILHGTFPYLAP